MSNETDLIVPADVEDPCAAEVSEYDLGLHVGALFIIMAASIIGTVVPIVAKKIAFLKDRAVLFACAKMFGVGVILATAFVHMFCASVSSLTNPCLPATFTEDYTALAGAVALGALLALQLIQFIVGKVMRSRLSSQAAVADTLHLQPSEDGKTAPLEDKGKPTEHKHHHHHEHEHDHQHGLLLRERQISAYLLELGVASHSIIIGVALGASRGPQFRDLLVALVFHQFNEGLGLSAVVLDSEFESRVVIVLTAAFYAITTPLGIAIGIGINSVYNENSTRALVTMGVLDAVSAGILLYDALVNVIQPHFRDPKFNDQSTLSQGIQITFLWVGAAIMALIGRWA